MSVYLLPVGAEPLALDGDVLVFAGPAGVGRVQSLDSYLTRVGILPANAPASDAREADGG